MIDRQDYAEAKRVFDQIRHELDTQPLTAEQRKELELHAARLAGVFNTPVVPSVLDAQVDSGCNFSFRGSAGLDWQLPTHAVVAASAFVFTAHRGRSGAGLGEFSTTRPSTNAMPSREQDSTSGDTSMSSVKNTQPQRMRKASKRVLLGETREEEGCST
jgi:hypothetical protein